MSRKATGGTVFFLRSQRESHAKHIFSQTSRGKMVAIGLEDSILHDMKSVETTFFLKEGVAEKNPGS